LFLAAGVAGYWGALYTATSWLRRPIAAASAGAARSGLAIISPAASAALTIIQQTRTSALTMGQPARISAMHQDIPTVALAPALSSLLGPNADRAPSRVLAQDRFAPIVLSFILAAIVPAAAVDFAVNHSAGFTTKWYLPDPNQPELVQFLTDN